MRREAPALHSFHAPAAESVLSMRTFERFSGGRRIFYGLSPLCLPARIQTAGQRRGKPATIPFWIFASGVPSSRRPELPIRQRRRVLPCPPLHERTRANIRFG